MENIGLNQRPSHGGNLHWAAEIAGCSPLVLLDFSASINPLGPPASAIAAIQSALGQVVHYPDPGYGELRQAIAQHHSVDPEWVLPGNGAAELLTWAARDLARLAATYLVTPAFGDYGRSLQAFEGVVVSCPLPLAAAEVGTVDWLTVITQGLHHEPARCGLLLNSPHNPTGLLIPAEVMETLVGQFAQVVVDEAFMDFLPPDRQAAYSVVPLVARYPNLVVVRSLTKFYSLPGLRLGYAIAHPDTLQRWQSWRDPWPVNTLAAAAARAVLGDRLFQRQTWEWLSTTRPALIAQLQCLPELHPLPGEANYLLLRCDRSATTLQLALLQRHRLLVRDCLSFPELGDRYLRIAIRTPAECDRLLTGLHHLLHLDSESVKAIASQENLHLDSA